MIVKDIVTFGDTEFMRHYSDAGYQIERDGIRYDEAIDPIDSGREYIETDELIAPVNEDPAEVNLP